MLEDKFISFPPSGDHSVVGLFEQMGDISRDTLYVCAPVTTPTGLLRKYDDVNRVKKANLGHAKVHLRNLTQAGLLPDAPLLVPGMVGEREGWDEVSYNSFLFMLWLGISRRNAGQFAQDIILSPDECKKMSTYSDPREKRLEYYHRFKDKVISAAIEYGFTALPVLALPRTEHSLGCGLELQIAKELAIPIHEVCVEDRVYRLTQCKRS